MVVTAGSRTASAAVTAASAKPANASQNAGALSPCSANAVAPWNSLASAAIALITLVYAFLESVPWILTLAFVQGFFWSGMLSASSAYMLSILPVARRAELAPGTWYLAVEQRGQSLIAQTQDGRRGVLQDTTGIQRG